MIAAWGFAEWFWNLLTLAVGGIVGLFALVVVVRMVEPRGLRALLRRR
jgi:hypothetical protein